MLALGKLFVGLTHELNNPTAAVKRISNLISSVKSYSHMDKSTEKQATDVVKGLESTLTMQGHKIKQKNLSVERRFAPDLPEISAHTGELNQVWTNVIDAAPDGRNLERVKSPSPIFSSWSKWPGQARYR